VACIACGDLQERRSWKIAKNFEAENLLIEAFHSLQVVDPQCDFTEITDTETVFLGTDLRLVYEISSSS